MKPTILKIYYITLKIKDNIDILYNKIIVSKLRKPIVKNVDETLDYIIDNNCSASRYGDGEFGLMRGQSLIFQTHSMELEKRLKEIIESFELNHLVCIPNVFDEINTFTEDAKDYWTKYLNLNRNRIYNLLNINKIYYDSLVTRLYMDQKDKRKVEERFNKIKLLWKNKDIVIVEGEKSRLGIGNDLFNSSKSISRIICPSKDAFSKYKNILDEVKRQNNSKLIFIALGPTATVLAYDLSKLGYQAVDIGHIDIEYEWFLQGATKKKPVENKYIGEIANGNEVGTIRDEYYESQIICRIQQ